MGSHSRQNQSFLSQILGSKMPKDPTTSFAGSTIIVTGANSGLGFEAAAKLVALKASHVILAVRDLGKGMAAMEAIEQRTGRAGVVDVWPLDMNSYDSMQALSARAEKDLEHLDGVVLNAGVFAVAYQPSPYGWEEMLQINVLSTVFLALILLPKLRASRRGSRAPVLEIVTSRRAEAVALRPEQLDGKFLESLNDEKSYRPGVQYRTSKLLAMCAVKTLASVSDPSEAVITAVCPGGAASNLSRGWTGTIASVLKVVLNTLVLRTTEQGSRSLVSGLTLGAESHGRFWYDDALHE